jgi:hypothetical protein
VGTPLLAATFRANTIGKEADRRIRGGLSRASVHSSYDGAVNVMTRLGLVSLVPPPTGRGPINVIVDGDFRLMPRSVARGDAVAMDKTGILIGSSILVSLEGSKVYDPSQRFPLPPLDDKFIRGNLQLARETVITQGRFSGMGSLLHSLHGETLSASWLGLNLYSRFALPRLRALISGLRDKNMRRVTIATKSIAGLGVGLTPSADDVLSGLMVALVLSVRNGLASGPFYLRAARAMAETTVGRSSILSQEYLEQASLGRSNEKVTRLIESICTGTPASVAESASDLMATGHASGTDTAAGVILGMAFVLQRRGGRIA